MSYGTNMEPAFTKSSLPGKQQVLAGITHR
jgi:hypothetical protein